ncbi:MAG: acyl-CoA thioesterase [Candidatus Firestonebacteria bacterium]
MQGKTVSKSATVLAEVMMPLYANHYGYVHGGTILKLIDEAAFVAATRHSQKNVVVASMDHITFKNHVHVGDILTLFANLCYVGKSSMEVEVKVETERLKTGEKLFVGSGYLTMVALDDNGRPIEVPRLILRTKEEKTKSANAIKRREVRVKYFKEKMLK